MLSTLNCPRSIHLKISVTTLGKILPLWQSFKIFVNYFGGYLALGQFFTLFWNFLCCCIGHFFTVINGQILNNNLAVCSHCLQRMYVLYLNCAQRTQTCFIMFICLTRSEDYSMTSVTRFGKISPFFPKFVQDFANY